MITFFIAWDVLITLFVIAWTIDYIFAIDKITPLIESARDKFTCGDVEEALFGCVVATVGASILLVVATLCMTPMTGLWLITTGISCTITALVLLFVGLLVSLSLLGHGIESIRNYFKGKKS